MEPSYNLSLSPYQYALNCEHQAEQTQDKKEKLFHYLNGAATLAPQKEDMYHVQKQKIEEYKKCAELFEKAGNLLGKGVVTESELLSYKQEHNYFYYLHHNLFSLPNNSMQTCLATCYFVAAQLLSTANQHEKLEEKKGLDWNEVDSHVQKLFKKAMANLQLIDSADLTPHGKAALIKYKIKILHEQGAHFSLCKGRKQEICDKIFKKEMKLYDLYTSISESHTKEKKWKIDWRSEMNRVRHLKNAALMAQTPEEKKELLLKAESIALHIEKNCETRYSCIEFNPQHKSYPEYSLLGEIQIELGHYVGIQLPFGNCSLLVVHGLDAHKVEQRCRSKFGLNPLFENS